MKGIESTPCSQEKEERRQAVAVTWKVLNSAENCIAKMPFPSLFTNLEKQGLVDGSLPSEFCYILS